MRTRTPGRGRGGSNPGRDGTVALALCGLLALSACGASETSEPDAELVADVSTTQDGLGDDGDVTSGPGVALTTQGTQTGPRVVLEGKAESADEFEVRVLVRDIPNLYGIAAHLVWDESALELVSHNGHLMMIATDMRSRTLVKPSGKSRLLLGAARYRDGGSPWAPLVGAKVTNQIWATLRFRVLTSGKHSIAFDPDHLLAKSSTYEDLALSWTSLDVARTANTGGQ